MNNLTDIMDRNKKEIVDFIDGVRKESYEQGKKDAIKEYKQTDDIEKSNFNPQMFKACTDTSHQCGYEQGKAEAIKDYKQSDEYIKECVQRYLKGKADGKVEAITDFAKWEDDNNINYYEFDNHEDVVKRYLAWKTKENK